MPKYKKGVPVRLTKNFKSTEFDCHGKGCCTETPIHEDLVAILQKVRDHFGVSVTVNSGYRCPVHNANVGGASKTSYHMTGQAADISVKGVHPVIVARYIDTLNVNGRVGCYTWNDKGSGFVHVDVRGTTGGKKSNAFYTENNTDYDDVPNFHPIIKHGTKGKEVIVAQRRLKELGYYKGSIDGICGPGTEQAISNFFWDKAFPID